jgi:4-hydroxy-tetrahydrodipicolinate synthase
MMIKQLQGILTALVTPFDAAGNIIERGYSETIQFQIDSGVHGLVVLATSGEVASLSFEEKKKVIDLALDANAGRLPILVGVGGTNARETFTLIDYSEAAGADGLFVITPYFYRFTREEYLAYYREISRRARTQILCYNSTYAGTPLDPEAIAELAALPNVTALKEGNPLQTPEVLRLTRGKLRVFTARDVYLCEMMSMGGSGGVFFSANAAPKLAVELYETLKAGDYDRGRELQFRLMPLV